MSFNSRKQLTVLYIDATYSKHPSNVDIWEMIRWTTINTLRTTWFRGFSAKKHLNARGFARELLRFGRLYRLGEGLKKRGQSSRLHSKKIFCVGVVCEWRHKWRTFRPPWPTLPGPGRQPLSVSISLKFLLETRLQSFDTLGDLLGFRVQKLWCKLVKILD